MTSHPTLTFLGAAGTVTGSRFLVETATARVLVDCGLYQGLKELRLRNWDPFPVDASALDAVVLTHAHLDHTGYVPCLVEDGFRGQVFATRDTVALAGIVLPDSGHLQEEEAAYANKRGFSRHHPARALYTEDDARQSLRKFRGVDFDAPVTIAPGVVVTFRPAGHILGSATVGLHLDGRDSILFSGDLGRPEHPILAPPAEPIRAATLVIESTYGDRSHEPSTEVSERLAAAINRTAKRGGQMVIPAFAVDRTEVVLHELNRLTATGRVPRLPVFVDSPMAIHALAVYRAAIREHRGDVREEVADDADPFDSLDLRAIEHVEDSKRLNTTAFPCLIVSASGMATGGRVLHHIAHRVSDPDCTIALVGFQAEGTRGRRLLDGERSLKMFGRYLPVRAEIVDVTAMSSHADAGELVDWASSAPEPFETIFVVHGEPHASAALQRRLEDELSSAAVVPKHLERVTI